ncbi:MAG: exo-alpha-sialidase, partial [Bryobacteraceae bacterium]
SPLLEHETLGRRKETGGLEAAITALVPAWHAKSGKLLATGSVIRYRGDKYAGTKAPRETGYSVYDPDARTWTPWLTLEMPGGRKFFNAGADSCQRVDLPNGEILLPVYYIPEGGDPKAYPVFRENGWAIADNAFATVVRCSFDGSKLRYLAHGDELRVEFQRGLDEPSLTRFRNRYYLTLRNDANGFVTSGSDGLHFGPLKPWTWDDGSDLGNYNTQQHWVTHSDGLFLVYTRRGAKNDHVFRHRAPLFMAQVDPEKMCVIRQTERVLVPERGARLGNFGVVNVNSLETWVVVSEYMQPLGCERHGSDNSVYAARIRWQKPNALAAQ